MTSSAQIESRGPPCFVRNIQVYKMGANPKEENRKTQSRRTHTGGRSRDTEDQGRDFEEHKRENAEPKEDPVR